MSKLELSEAARKAKNEYHRQWRKKNPEKVKQANLRHWEKKAQEQLSDSPEHNVLILHKQGLSLRQIADRTGISHTQVSRIINKCNDVTDTVTGVTK
ncbi:MAG: helix-turn-helix domain-containing protein [Bacteroidales bacterium]|nr:helix-turn-helix domain-containing protein [Bacteroidales bacterium]